MLGAIKTATGIAVTILEKQLSELRRRLNTTGHVNQAPIRKGWSSLLRLDVSGTPERNEANVLTALSGDAAFAGALVFDEFSQEIVITRGLPWDGTDIILPRPWGEPTTCGVRNGCSATISTCRRRWWVAASSPSRETAASIPCAII